MDNSVNVKNDLSWGWIIFFLFIFFPIGLILVVIKNKNMENGKASSLLVVGWFLLVFGGIGFIGCITEPTPPDGTVLAIIFAFIGVLLILKARKIKKQAEKFRKYIDVTVYGGEKSIDNIAGAVGLQYEAVMKDLQHMIDSGYLKNTYINQANREILLKQVVQSHVQPINVQASKPIQSKAVRCPGCGANNIVSNSGICECEYCGTPLTV